ncbi:hypothetical protein JCM11251_000100 [Rhodosporidiobolus azoricus]
MQSTSSHGEDAMTLDSFSAATSSPTSAVEPAGNAAGLPILRRGEAVETDLTPWMKDVQRRNGNGWEREPVQLLDEEIVAFVRWCRPTIAEHDFRRQVFALFERIVQRLWPGAQVHLFGSGVTGLYLPHGDFDVVVNHDALHRLPTVQILRSLASALRNAGFALFSSIELVTTAKVPLCKFRTAPSYGSFRFDVSFNGPNGPRGAIESLRLMAELEAVEEGAKDRVRRLVFVVKAALDSWKLNEVKHGGLGGLSTFCLAVSFIQHHPGSANTSAGSDLLEFLRYYLDFNYRAYSITTANGGGIIDKRQARWSLPRDAERLSIQHPVDLGRDLSSGSHKWDRILASFARTYEFLRAFLENADPALLNEPSVLQMLGIRFAPQVLAQRTANQQLARDTTFAELAKTWEPPNVSADPALQRMQRNGFLPFVSLPPTPSPTASTTSASNSDSGSKGEAFSPELGRYARLAPAASVALNPQQHTVVRSANPVLAAQRASQATSLPSSPFALSSSSPPSAVPSRPPQAQPQQAQNPHPRTQYCHPFYQQSSNPAAYTLSYLPPGTSPFAYTSPSAYPFHPYSANYPPSVHNHSQVFSAPTALHSPIPTTSPYHLAGASAGSAAGVDPPSKKGRRSRPGRNHYIGII